MGESFAPTWEALRGADAFEAINAATIAAVADYTDAQWAAVCPGEGWSVGTIAHHLAVPPGVVLDPAEGRAAGRPLPPLTWALIHAGNTQHAARFATCDRDETIALLRPSGAASGERIRALADEQLDRASPWGLADGASLTVEQLIDRHIIAHAREHLASIGATAQD